MKLEIARKRTVYALDTFVSSWVLSARRFGPLFGAWLLSLAGPVVLLVIGVIFGLGFDQTAWGASIAWGAIKSCHIGWGTLMGFVIPGLLIGWLWAGWILVSLKVARGIDIRVTDVFRPLPQVMSAFVVLIATTLLISAFSWLVVPAAFFFLKFQLAPFYIVDRNFGPFKAMKQSWKDTDMVFVPLVMLDLLFVGIQILTATVIFGPLICHIGMTVASALVYSKWLIDDNHPDIPKIED